MTKEEDFEYTERRHIQTEKIWSLEDGKWVVKVPARLKKEWLIWSIERTAWWKPNQNGYTPSREAAGRFSIEEACNVLKNSNRFSGDVPQEAMVRYVSLTD